MLNLMILANAVAAIFMLPAFAAFLLRPPRTPPAESDAASSEADSKPASS